MKLSVIGSGYVGLTVGACFANLGNKVMCVDTDISKITALKHGKVPFFEPGLQELLTRNMKEQRLIFTVDIKAAVQHAEILFIAVGTPEGKDHKADLTFVKQAAADIGKNIDNYKVIVTKSTVPVGTASMIKDIIKKHAKAEFDVVSNPEFLREGAAVKDFENPDRIIIGADSEKAAVIMKKLYGSIARTGRPIMVTGLKSAEIIKYAANAMLATRISFMNELSHLCEKAGADIKEVAKGIGLDTRIGPRFLHAGIGYGGSCFPKDIKALIQTLKENRCEAKILEAVESVNELQKRSVLPKLKKLLHEVKGKKTAIWGLSFKPKTDDMREAPSLTVIRQLLEAGAAVSAYDPVAEGNARKLMPDIHYAKSPYDAAKDADAIIIMTEWDEFRELDLKMVKSAVKQAIIIDCRNIYSPEEMKQLGFRYASIGR